MRVGKNALIKSNRGSVRHYGYFNKDLLKWIPLCGQSTSRCSPLYVTQVPENFVVEICESCLENQLTHQLLHEGGLEPTDREKMFRVHNEEHFKNRHFTVDETFWAYKKGLQEARS